MSFQFAHWATFSRKGTGHPDRKNADPTKRHRGLTVSQIAGEAGRVPGDCPHVLEPRAPVVIFGMDPMAALAEHDALLARQTVACRGLGRGRGIRADTHTMSGIVLSYPTPCRDLDDPAAYESWRDDALAWLHAEHQRRGLRLLSVVEHLDEEHPHIHALAVALNPRIDVKLCHPGHIALTEHEGPQPSLAFKAAMRTWQDSVYTGLSAAHGHLRIGPRKRRLSRASHNAEKAQAAAIAAAMQQAQADRDRAAILLAEAQATAAEQLAAHDRAAAALQEATQARQEAMETRREAQAEKGALSIAVEAWAGGELLDAGTDEPGGTLEPIYAETTTPNRRIAIERGIRPAWHTALTMVQQLADMLRPLPAEMLRQARRVIASRWQPGQPLGPR